MRGKPHRRTRTERWSYSSGKTTCSWSWQSTYCDHIPPPVQMRRKYRRWSCGVVTLKATVDVVHPHLSLIITYRRCLLIGMISQSRYWGSMRGFWIFHQYRWEGVKQTFHQHRWEGFRHFITWGSSANGSDFYVAVVDDGVDVSLAVTTSYRHLIFVQKSTTGGVIFHPPCDDDEDATDNEVTLIRPL